MKKILSIIAALSIIIGAFSMFSVTAGAATDKVSLYSSEVFFSKYGITGTNVFVQTKDNAGDQKVTVHYNNLEGKDWLDAKAEYVTTLEDGSKIWKAYINSFNTEYVIKYEGDGNVTWDNNGGKNYKTETIGTAPIAVNRETYQNLDSYKITATLQNYGYNKDVKVVYTVDGWKTSKEAAMTYVKTNDDGTEQWSTTLREDDKNKDGFQYCVSYTVNGQTFWANNFGKNYDVTYRINH